jgi:FtsH-binding integral membrane protein
MNFKEMIQSIFSADGNLSFKRVGSGVTLIVLFVLAFISTLTESKTPDYIYDWLVIIVLTGFGGTAAENIIKAKQPQNPS